MKFILSIVSILLASLSALGQNIQRHEVKVGDFTQLRVINAINVDYKSHPDSAGIAVFQAPVNLVNVIMFINNGKGKLSIELDLADTKPDNLPTITVYSRFLTSIENIADSTVRAFNINAGPKFKARLEGNGRLSLREVDTEDLSAKVFTGRGQLAVSGRCTNASLSCAGPCAIQADMLSASKVKATVNGTSTIGCHADTELTIMGIGSGTVYYSGEPLIKNRSVGVKAIAINK